MTRATVYRHMIDYGEDLHWTPPAGAVVFFAWLKFTVDNAAMRWWRVAGWDVVNDLALVLPDTPASAGISLTGAEVALDWAALVGLFDGYDSQIIQISTLNAAGRAYTRNVYSLPEPTSVNVNTIAAQERQVLKSLLSRTPAAPQLSLCRWPPSTGVFLRSGPASGGSNWRRRVLPCPAWPSGNRAGSR